ncbi:MAG: substrate-binding domain-containing protein, partial [Planctomycetota bacterium]
ASSSAKVPLDVSAGEAAMGMCIDFYGSYQSSVVGQSESGVWRVGYVAPTGETVVTADPVAVLRGAPRRELAERFVRFLLSEEGQALWMYRLGEAGGPRRFELRRPPIRRDMYTPERRAKMADDANPFEIASALPEGTPSYFSALVPVIRAMAMDRHDQLKDAWHAVYSEPDPARRAKMESLFDALPFTPDELRTAVEAWRADPATRSRDRLAWGAFFSERYRQVIAMGDRDGGS